MLRKEWINADWRLPASANLPVEVVLGDGKSEIRDVLTGDWRAVVRWRTVDKEPGRKKKAA